MRRRWCEVGGGDDRFARRAGRQDRLLSVSATRLSKRHVGASVVAGISIGLEPGTLRLLGFGKRSLLLDG